MASEKAVHNEPDQVPSKEEASQEPHPTFGPHPNTQVADIDFKKEVGCLPFKLNLEDVPLDLENQTKFINLFYSNQEVFSLHDEDYSQLTHTIPIRTNIPVYLPHRTILRQMQGEVCQCHNIWLHQGIIHPSNSPNASQVVIAHKKSGEIHLCVDYRKLNSITTRDAFPLPLIDKELQAVHSSNVSTSFDLVQGYLQLAMAEEDIRTIFRAGSSGLYEFTHMPFVLSNARSASPG